MPIDAQRVWDRCQALARHSEQPDGLTRVYRSPEQRAANELGISMRDALAAADLDFERVGDAAHRPGDVLARLIEHFTPPHP